MHRLSRRRKLRKETKWQWMSGINHLEIMIILRRGCARECAAFSLHRKSRFLPQRSIFMCTFCEKFYRVTKTLCTFENFFCIVTKVKKQRIICLIIVYSW